MADEAGRLALESGKALVTGDQVTLIVVAVIAVICLFLWLSGADE